MVEAVLGVVVEEQHGLALYAGGALQDGVVSHGSEEPGLALCGELLCSVAQARLEADRAIQWRGHGPGAIAACFSRRAAVAYAARATGFEFAHAGALWSAPARQDAEGDNDEPEVYSSRCARGTDKGVLFIVVELDVAERPRR